MARLLETLLMGIALRRNPQLRNIRDAPRFVRR
jgi:hypothetical protein